MRIRNKIVNMFTRRKSMKTASGKITANDKICYGIQAVALAALCVCFGSGDIFAAGNGMAGINEATSMISSYFDPGV